VRQNERQLNFFDQPSVYPLDVGEFFTTLVGVRNDGSWCLLPGTTFHWYSDFHGMVGGIVLIAASCLALTPTNGPGGVESLQTNVQPANIDPDALAAMLQAGGSFAIRIQPAAQSVAAGGNVTFSIFPTNTSSPINYQWRINGTNISNATNLTLQLLNVTMNNTGNYDAVLSNSYGSIASAVATLTVVNVPILRAPLILTNGQVLLTWTAPAGKTYQLQYTTNLNQTNWISLGSTITASNTVMSATNAIGSDKQRFYRVQQQ
jgi:hypothetical protein